MRYLTALLLVPLLMIFDIVGVLFTVFIMCFHDDWPFSWALIKKVWDV